jgi:hypothetical protein
LTERAASCIIPAVRPLCFFFVCLAAARAWPVDVNVAEDEARKAEAAALAPLEGEGYYDSTDLAEWALVRARRSPTGAMWRSLAVPGWGQVYNGQYLKGAAIIAAEGVTLYTAIDNYRISRKYLREAREAGDRDLKQEKFDRYNDYVVETEFWGWLFVGFIAYSAMDAYVDAHLADWDVSDLPADKEASSRFSIEPDGLGFSVSISLL